LYESNEISLKIGDKVEIKNKFDGDWSRGYIISRVDTSSTGDEIFYVKRAAEIHEIPQHFTSDHIRKAKKKNMWWI
jgi:hypothetical protein